MPVGTYLLCALYSDVLWRGVFLRPIVARLSKWLPFWGIVILMTFMCALKMVHLLS